MLTLHNSLTQKKEPLTFLHPGKVGLYVCGMTVYDYCHIGHARMMTVFDMVVRYLRSQGLEVTYVRNITDVDDKIIKRAQENGETITVLTERVIKAMYEDTDRLGLLRPDKEPRATDYIPHMIELISKLMKNGLAYVSENGDVCYEVAKFKTYGELSHQDLEDLRAGSRVEINESKRDPLDFVLWKHVKPGEPSWDSPWGPGRPGWHIECSAMSTHCLGEHFDLHGGGLDLIFPHHQNEIAQSEGATEKKFVNFWMHSGFVQINEEKMSKSLGNFFTVREVLEKYDAEVVRYFLLASHYRSPLNYSDENLESAKHALTRLYTALRGISLSSSHTKIVRDPEDKDVFFNRFIIAMDDDLNTPEALAVLFDLAREMNRLKETNDPKVIEKAVELRELASILGLLQRDPEDFLRGKTDEEEKNKIEQLIAARNEARKNKNWVESDRLRNLLTEMGVNLEDTASGTLWRRVE